MLKACPPQPQRWWWLAGCDNGEQAGCLQLCPPSSRKIPQKAFGQYGRLPLRTIPPEAEVLRSRRWGLGRAGAEGQRRALRGAGIKGGEKRVAGKGAAAAASLSAAGRPR